MVQCVAQIVPCLRTNLRVLLEGIAHLDGAHLFDEEKDPIAVIKWKEVFDYLEEATDRCEDVANVLEGVVVKHG